LHTYYDLEGKKERKRAGRAEDERERESRDGYLS